MPENEATPAVEEDAPPVVERERRYDPFDADRWAECTDPDDSDYLEGTAMSRN